MLLGGLGDAPRPAAGEEGAAAVEGGSPGPGAGSDCFAAVNRKRKSPAVPPDMTSSRPLFRSDLPTLWRIRPRGRNL